MRGRLCVPAGRARDAFTFFHELVGVYRGSRAAPMVTTVNVNPIGRHIEMCARLLRLPAGVPCVYPISPMSWESCT